MKIPKEYLPVVPYLSVEGAREFFDFMKATFGATEQLIVPYDDGKVRHGELRVGDAVIMFSEVTDKNKKRPAAMFIYVEDVDGVYARALKNGATDLHAPLKQDYGYTAGFEDKYGNQWWIVQGEAD
ncbi:MAG TPA: VOC family protein [Chitinophagales bacterium]|nr:VOC family protein [Chitinophagales bacterium]